MGLKRSGQRNTASAGRLIRRQKHDKGSPLQDEITLVIADTRRGTAVI